MSVHATVTPRAPLPGGASLAGASAPPLALPGSHFAAALLFWTLGAAGLVWIAPDLAAGIFPLRRVVAVTHLFTLGWVTTSILGALCQLFPVVLGQPVRSIRAGVPGARAARAGHSSCSPSGCWPCSGSRYSRGQRCSGPGCCCSSATSRSRSRASRAAT